MAETAKPRYQLIEKNTSWNWTRKEQNAFESLKLFLTRAPLLVLYDSKLPLNVACDASLWNWSSII